MQIIRDTHITELLKYELENKYELVFKYFFPYINGLYYIPQRVWRKPLEITALNNSFLVINISQVNKDNRIALLDQTVPCSNFKLRNPCSVIFL